VPDRIVLDMLKEHVQNLTSSSIGFKGSSRNGSTSASASASDASNGAGGGIRLLLDGFPRTVSQAMELEKFLPVRCVIVLEIPHATIINRISNRTIHLPSGRVYNKTYNPEKKTGVDDITGEPLGM